MMIIQEESYTENEKRTVQTHETVKSHRPHIGTERHLTELRGGMVVYNFRSTVEDSYKTITKSATVYTRGLTCGERDGGDVDDSYTKTR